MKYFAGLMVIGLIIFILGTQKRSFSRHQQEQLTDKDKDKESNAEEVNFQNLHKAIPSPLPTKGAEKLKDPAVAPFAPPQVPKAAPSEARVELPGNAVQSKSRFLKKDDFINLIKSRDLRQWLAEAHAIKSFHDVTYPGLEVSHEAGIIIAGKQQIEFRYDVGGRKVGSAQIPSESCVSIQPSLGRLILGSLGDGSLALWRLPVENAYLIGINDQHFFVRYTDADQGRQLNEFGEPRPPILTFALLYFQRQSNGQITYQGQLEKFTDDDHDMQLRYLDFCRFSFENEG